MRSLLLFFALGITVSLAGQDYALSALSIPAELKVDAESVVREYHQEYHVKSPRESTLSVRKVVSILGDDHGKENQLVVFYDNKTRITRFKATLYDALGEKVRDAKKSEIEDVSAISGGQFYTDSRVKTTTLTHLSYPYTVEFEYEVKMVDFGAVSAPNWKPQYFDQSVEHSSFTAHIPSGNKLNYRANELPEPSISSEGAVQVLKWEVENLPARKWEPEAPPSSKTLPYLHTALETFAIGDIQMTNRDWESFGKQMLQLHQGIRELPPSLGWAVLQATQNLNTDREKIDALYRLLQDRTRYVGVQLGVGGWKPFSATYVEENRFGDCKALSNYMRAMLTEVGIESYPVLVHWSDQPYLSVEPDFTASAFNHMILYIPSEEMYLECTSNVSPPGYLGDGKQDRNVLWLTPEGGKLVRTPAHKPGENGHVRTTEIEVLPAGDAKFSMRAGFFGAAQEMYRQFVHSESNPVKQLEVMHRAGLLPDVRGTDFNLAVAPDAPQVDLSYSSQVPGYVRKLGRRMFVPLNKYSRYAEVPDKMEERQYPIVRTEARFMVDTVRLTLPKNLEIESLGDAITEYKHAAGEYRAEVTTAPGKITLVRTLKLLSVELPAAEYDAYRAFFVNISKAEKRQVVLREKRTK